MNHHVCIALCYKIVNAFLIFFLVLDCSTCCCSLNVIVPGAGVNRDTCAKQEPGNWFLFSTERVKLDSIIWHK